jgi:hypothetical protein
LRLPGRGPLAAGVAVPAQELGDLGFEGRLHEQANPETGDLFQDVAEVLVRSEQLVDVGADALGG